MFRQGARKLQSVGRGVGRDLPASRRAPKNGSINTATKKGTTNLIEGALYSRSHQAAARLNPLGKRANQRVDKFAEVRENEKRGRAAAEAAARVQAAKQQPKKPSGLLGALMPTSTTTQDLLTQALFIAAHKHAPAQAAPEKEVAPEDTAPDERPSSPDLFSDVDTDTEAALENELPNYYADSFVGAFSEEELDKIAYLISHGYTEKTAIAFVTKAMQPAASQSLWGHLAGRWRPVFVHSQGLEAGAKLLYRGILRPADCPIARGEGVRAHGQYTGCETSLNAYKVNNAAGGVISFSRLPSVAEKFGLYSLGRVIVVDQAVLDQLGVKTHALDASTESSDAFLDYDSIDGTSAGYSNEAEVAIAEKVPKEAIVASYRPGFPDSLRINSRYVGELRVSGRWAASSLLALEAQETQPAEVQLRR